MSSTATVLFRVDASASMGLGHFMRCLAIAEAVTDQGGTAVFAMVDPPLATQAMMSDTPARSVTLSRPSNSQADLGGLLELIRSLEPCITVVDGYHFDDTYLRAIKQRSPLAVLWDSADRQKISVDLIIDASSNASADAYAAISPGALVLLGAEHALIRRDIRRAARLPQVPLADRQQLVLSFGGSDPLNLSMALLPGLRDRLPSSVGITVLAGAAYPHQQDLLRLADSLSPLPEVVINPPSVVPVFFDAGLVVTAAGGTIGELVALRLPALAVVVAQNQVAASVHGPYPCIDGRLVGAPDRIVAMVSAMWRDLPRRENLVEQLRGKVDGEGAWRVANALLATRFA